MAQFRTAFDQATVPFDVNVVGTVNEKVEVTATNRKAAIIVGDFVKLTPATATIPAYITKATAAEVTAKTATHIVALSDMTMGTGHVPTEYKDYRPSELVGAQLAAAPTNANTAKKKVALWPIWDWNDVIPDVDAMDRT